MISYRLSLYSAWLVEVIAYLLVTLSTGTAAQSITPPGDNVVEGRPFTLQCGVNRGAFAVAWTRIDGNNIVAIYQSYSCDPTITLPSSAPSGFSGSCTIVNDEEVYSLTIESVTVNMEDFTWRCARFSPDGSTNVALSVKVIVTSVSLVGPSTSVVAGTPATFTCTTSRSKPKACAKWFIQRLNTAAREITTGQSVCNQDLVTLQTISTLQFTGTAQDDEANLFCTAVNSVTDTPVQSLDYSLTVQYPPRSEITLTGYVSGTPVESGRSEPISMSCGVGEGNPNPTLTWDSVCGDNKVSGNDGRQPISLTVTPSLNGKSCVCRGNQAGTGWTREESVIFNITFGPDSVALSPGTSPIQENNTVTITCTSKESNPAAILSLYNNNIPIPSSEITSVSPTTGTNNGYIVSGRYSVRPTRYQDGHVITCEAYRPGRQDTPVSSELTLDVQYKPQIRCNKSQLKLFEGQHIILICEILSKPVPIISWTKDGKDVGQKYTTRGNLTSHLSAKVDIPSAEASDSGVFRITASNVLGSSHQDVMIEVIEGQIIPQDVKVIHCIQGQAELIWPSGISQSVVEYYKLESRESQKEWERILVRNPGKGRLVEKTLTGLQTGVQYEFRVQPNTDVALSEFATTNCTVENSGMSNARDKLFSGTEITGAGIGVGIVVGAIFVLLGVVLLWIFRRRNLPSSAGAENIARRDRNELPAPPGEETTPRTIEGNYEELNTRQSTGPSYDSLTMDSPGSTPIVGQHGPSSVYQNTSAL